MDLNPDILKKSLREESFVNKFYYYDVTGSTNDEAFNLGMAGEPEGTVVIADAQTKGRGRLQRSWHSPAGSNIYTTIILRPTMDPAVTPQISILAGVAVAEVLESYCPGRIKVKWPNDILIDGKKVCGILSQAKADVNKVDFVILGIGINVNINKFPDEISDIATSLSMETGRVVSRQQLIISLYENLTKWYKKLLKCGFGQIKERWLALSQMIGRNVQVIFQDEVISGLSLIHI
jgi:BirA family biotin operon repressor/biotin-[acetyl-CoA-carboxylase] ligase